MRAEWDNHPAQAYITRKNANFHTLEAVWQESAFICPAIRSLE